MTTIFDPTRNVKPTAPASFGRGLVPAHSPRFVPSAADLAWAASELNRDSRDYDVVVSAPRPISGGGPCEVQGRLAAESGADAEWDALAAEALAVDSLTRGLIPADLADAISRTSLVGHPA